MFGDIWCTMWYDMMSIACDFRSNKTSHFTRCGESVFVEMDLPKMNVFPNIIERRSINTFSEAIPYKICWSLKLYIIF